MKNFTYISIVVLFSICIQFESHAQQVIQASIGTINRQSPKIGFNGQAVITPKVNPVSIGANWTQQAFMDSVAILAPEIIRFPGGSNSNHWDWQTGWYVPEYAPSSTALTMRFEEFQPALTSSNAEGLFVVNLETSNVNYEMAGLRHADSLGLNPQLFELGNEHNLNGVVGAQNFPLQLMTPTYYSQLSKIYYDSIKSEFPLAKVCAVGGNTNGDPGWNDTLLQHIPNIDAFAFHVYLDANNSDLAFNVNRALAIPFGNVNDNASLAFRFNKTGFDSLPPAKEVWVTEYNLHELASSSATVIAGTWTHLLYVTAFNNFLLSKTNVTMFLNHALAAVFPHYESIAKVDNHITANGIAMKLLLDVAKGSTTCQNITFAGNPSMTSGNTTIPKLIAWKFNHAASEKGFICNFSVDTFKLALSSVFTNPMQFDQFYADTNFVVNGLSSVNKFSGSSSDSIVIYPFSITQINSSLIAGAQEISSLGKKELLIYPNPSDEMLYFSEPLSDFSILNTLGQEVFRSVKSTNSISTQNFKNGIYFLKTQNSCVKFIVKH